MLLVESHGPLQPRVTSRLVWFLGLWGGVEGTPAVMTFKSQTSFLLRFSHVITFL